MLQVLTLFEPYGESHVQQNPHLMSVRKEESMVLDFTSLETGHSRDTLAKTPPLSRYSLHAASTVPRTPLGVSTDERIIEHPPHSSYTLPRVSIENTALAIEDEIYLSNTMVIWSRGGRVQKVLKYENEKKPIRYAFFSWLPYYEGPGSGEKLYRRGSSLALETQKQKKDSLLRNEVDNSLLRKCLCIVLETYLHLHFMNGLDYTIHPPFIVGNVCVLEIGFLLQKSKDDMNKIRYREDQKYEERLEKMYHLKHRHTVFDDICKEEEKRRKERLQPTLETEYIAITGLDHITVKTSLPKDHQLVSKDAIMYKECPFIVTFHKEENRHYVWTYTLKAKKYSAATMKENMLKRTSKIVKNDFINMPWEMEPLVEDPVEECEKKKRRLSFLMPASIKYLREESDTSEDRASRTLRVSRERELQEDEGRISRSSRGSRGSRDGREEREWNGSEASSCLKKTYVSGESVTIKEEKEGKAKRNSKGLKTTNPSLVYSIFKRSMLNKIQKGENMFKIPPDSKEKEEEMKEEGKGKVEETGENKEEKLMEFFLLWVEDNPRNTNTINTQKSSEVFVADGLYGRKHLCIMNHQQNHLIIMDMDKLKDNSNDNPKVLELETSSALPICATRSGLNDILLVQNNALRLIIDACSPDTIMDIPLPLNMLTMKIERLKDSVNERFNIVSATQVTRCLINLKLCSCLVLDCIAAIYCALDNHSFSKFRKRLLQYHFNHQIEDQMGRKKVDDEWKSFTVVLLSFLKIEGSDLIYPENVYSAWIKESICIGKDGLDDYTEYVHKILNALHLLYEDYRFITMKRTLLPKIRDLLHCLSNLLKEDEWTNYYVSHGANPSVDTQYHINITTSMEFSSGPIDIHLLLQESIHNKDDTSIKRQLKDFFAMDLNRGVGHNEYGAYIRKLTCVYIGIIQYNSDPIKVITCAMKDWQSKDVDAVHPTFAQPIVDILNAVKLNPPLNLSGSVYSLIGRYDIVEQLQNALKIGDPNSSMSQFFEEPAIRNSDVLFNEAIDLKRETANFYGSDSLNKEIEQLRFGYSGLVSNIRNKLDVTKVNEAQMTVMPNEGAEDVEKEQQRLVVNIAQRTMAQAIGRGMYCYRTYKQNAPGSFLFEDINLSVKMLPLKQVVEIDTNLVHVNYLDWPKFHMGVSAGLCINPDVDTSDNWIKQLKSTETDPQYGGLFLALGLNGYLLQLPSGTWHERISEISRLVASGFLLGLATAYRGSKKNALFKIMSMNIPQFMSDGAVKSSEASIIWASCIMGLGLVYMESMDKNIINILMNELSKSIPKARDSNIENLESIGLSAGFAIGFVTLGKGSGHLGLPDMNIEDRLRRLMNGETPDIVKNHSSNQVFRGKGDLDATGPGAIMALALMFLKTENVRIADEIYKMNSKTHISYVRPEFFLLRVIARNLILWNGIQSTREWIDEQLPSLILSGINNKQNPPWQTHVWNQAMFHIIAGACLCIGLKYAGSRDVNAFQCLLERLDYFMEMSEIEAVSFQERITKCAIKTSIDVIVSAAAMVMAGSGNVELFRRLNKLRERTEFIERYGSQMSIHMAIGLLYVGLGGYTLRTDNESIAALLCAFYPFYPTSSIDNQQHLQSLRHFWVLALDSRWLTSFDVESQAPCRVPIVMTIVEEKNSETTPDSEEKEIRMMTPFSLPLRESIRSMRIDSPEYFPLCIKFNENNVYQQSILQRGIIYVQKYIK